MDTTLLRPYPRKLFMPGQTKPTGLPKIDWSHPLTQKLISFWFPFGDSGYIDLVTGDVTKKGTGVKNTLPVPNVTNFGTGPGLTVGTSFCESTNLGPIQSWSAPYSFACGWYQLGAYTSSGTAGWFALGDTAGNAPFAIFNGGATSFTWSYGNSGGQPTFTITTNTFFVVVGSATGATTQANYVNGLTQTAGAATSAFSGSGLRYLFGNVTADSGDTTGIINSLIYFGAAWNGRALSQTDAALLYTDPYCFLLPQEPEMMIIQSAVVDVLQAQVWM